MRLRTRLMLCVYCIYCTLLTSVVLMLISYWSHAIRNQALSRQGDQIEAGVMYWGGAVLGLGMEKKQVKQ